MKFARQGLSILNPSGGISYHWRALWNGKRWQPFCGYVESWLLEWLQDPRISSSETLVLIGPNAGYTLPLSFVAHFKHLIVVDPDPLAFALFQARFMRQATWLSEDFIMEDPQKLRILFNSYSSAVFLFCNVLGQLPVLLKEKNVSNDRQSKKNIDIEKYMGDLGSVLQDVAKNKKFKIASYHDRYSYDHKKPQEVIDHLTGELFKGVADKHEFPWQVTARHIHQVEFVRIELEAVRK